MIQRTDNSINSQEGYIPTIVPEDEAIFKFRVHGTFFPTRADPNTSRTSYIEIYSEDYIDNKIYIDYQDGTGWHEYPFRKPSTAMRVIRFQVNTYTNTPENIASGGNIGVMPNDGMGGEEYGLHFYQDLVDTSKINTVDHHYPQERDILIKFENRNFIKTIIISDCTLLGEIPSLAKLRNLKNLQIAYIYNASSFENAAVRTLIEIVFLSSLGFSINEIPLWIRNSPIRTLNLSGYILLPTLSDFENGIGIFKKTLEQLVLNRVGMNYKLPATFSEFTKLQRFEMGIENGTNTSNNFQFPDDLSQLVNFNNFNIQELISFPVTQIKRYIQEVPSSNKILNMRTWGSTSISKNIILDYDDYSVTEINIAYGRWNNGAPPSFIGQMKNLKSLSIYGSYNYGVSNGSYNLTDWGDFSGADNLEKINIQWQQKMSMMWPSWFTALKKLKTFDCHASFETLDSMDNFVDSVYNFVIENASINIGNTQFRQMNIITYSASLPANSWRPSGTYQAPSGYVQGSNNGSPVNQMEKIYVLINQYAHSWTIKPI
ncbi:hypothetical protein [Flavobacterium sp. MK4S-17]|uniref:hypothetical protein n=1 Tax=Flavobacterium sp. MK4S-17 TaxID=2543737 RepID=UPI00135BB52A|nr:hypothetical protein [Flavobacterium sp. MK4S-17]